MKSNYGELARQVSNVVEPGGWALFCTNCRGVGEAEFLQLVAGSCGRGRCRSVEMPPEYRGERYLRSVWVDFA